jgi:hypothetical protein
LKISSTENKCQLRKWFFNFLKVFSSFFCFFFLKFFSIGRAYLFVFFFEKFFLFSIMYDVANTFFSAFYEFLWGFLEIFLKFLCVISGVFFCMYVVVVVEAIIYGGIFRSNCENFESFF